MSILSRVNRKVIRHGIHDIGVIVLNQVEVNITVREENGHFVLIDTVDSGEMFVLASLLYYAMHTHEEQLRISANKDLVILNASRLGFELLFHSCCYLATSYLGHSHFDTNSTKSSPELIIRNIARN